MEQDTEKARRSVEDVLRGNKALTEREVKSVVGKTLRVKPQEVPASLIRDVRRGLGIDRPSALAFARSILAKEPGIEAKKVMDAVQQRYGIRIGPPDVSRLRPETHVSSRAGRPPRDALSRAGGASSTVVLKKGVIEVTFRGAGSPADLAAFFLELGRKKQR